MHQVVGVAAVVSLVAIDVKMVFKSVPMVVTDAAMTTEIKPAIRPYSIAVAPDSSFKNCVTGVVQFFMMKLQMKLNKT